MLRMRANDNFTSEFTSVHRKQKWCVCFFSLQEPLASLVEGGDLTFVVVPAQ